MTAVLQLGGRIKNSLDAGSEEARRLLRERERLLAELVQWQQDVEAGRKPALDLNAILTNINMLVAEATEVGDKLQEVGGKLSARGAKLIQKDLNVVWAAIQANTLSYVPLDTAAYEGEIDENARLIQLARKVEVHPMPPSSTQCPRRPLNLLIPHQPEHPNRSSLARHVYSHPSQVPHFTRVRSPHTCPLNPHISSHPAHFLPTHLFWASTSSLTLHSSISSSTSPHYKIATRQQPTHAACRYASPHMYSNHFIRRTGAATSGQYRDSQGSNQSATGIHQTQATSLSSSLD